MFNPQPTTLLRKIALIALLQISFILANNEFHKLNEKYEITRNFVTYIDRDENDDFRNCIAMTIAFGNYNMHPQLEKFESHLYEIRWRRSEIEYNKYKDERLDKELKTKEDKADEVIDFLRGKIGKEKAEECKKEAKNMKEKHFEYLEAETKRVEELLKAFKKKNNTLMNDKFKKEEVQRARELQTKLSHLLVEITNKKA